MSTINEIGKEAGKQVKSFMSGKPVWVYWIVYSAVVGVVFGLAYAVITLLVLKWWVLAIAILLPGIVIGTITYFRKQKELEVKEEK
jgi:uncharacterized membrane protein